MNAASPQDSTVRYYNNRDSAGVWTALVAAVGIIAGGSSLAEHSWALTSGLLAGTVAAWWLGYWVLSKTCYFISATKVGFKDAFRSREVNFEEVHSVIKHVGRYSQSLNFVCNTQIVTMPLAVIDESWYSAVKSELLKRGIPITTSMLGFVRKEQ